MRKRKRGVRYVTVKFPTGQRKEYSLPLDTPRVQGEQLVADAIVRDFPTLPAAQAKIAYEPDFSEE